MDSFELNKILGAVLFALLVTFGLSIFSEIIFETEAPETPGYVIAVETASGDDGGEVEGQPIAVLLASADPGAGEGLARQCGACHTFGEGEPNKVGPNLWSVVNRPIASHEGFEYSPEMQAYAAEAQTWTFDNLNAYLQDPKGMVPGTLMNFPGVRNDQQRANVIAYLNTLSASPAPLPEPTAAEEAPAEGAAPAEGEAPAEGAAPAEGEPTEGAAPAEGGAPAEEAAPSDGTEAPAAADEDQAAEAAAPAAEQPAEATPAEAVPAEGEATAESPPAEESPAAAEPAADQAAVAAAPAEEAAAPAAGAESAFGALVAAADAATGEGIMRRCLACHSVDKDAGSIVGPNLVGIVGRPVASLPDYEYSPAMLEFAEGGARTWTHDELSAYLTSPREVVPGTRMIFPGLPSEKDRADLIAYLGTLAE